MPDHQRRAFDALERIIDAERRPLVIDGGCGTGESTRQLARALPDHLVVGVDKSMHRLERGRADEQTPSAPLLIRMDLAWLWRALAASGRRVAHQLLLYPNPWPKPAHLRRRWHGHPAFGAMLAVGGTLELRTNWPIYAEEMRVALELVGAKVRVEGGSASSGEEVALPYDPAAISTAFERKYSASGHALTRAISRLDPVASSLATAAAQRCSSSSSTATS